MSESRYNQLDDESIDRIIWQFFVIIPQEDVAIVKEEFDAIRKNKYLTVWLELMLAKSRIDFKKFSRLYRELEAMDARADALMTKATNLKQDVANRILEQLVQQMNHLIQKPKDIARKGGLGRAAKYDRLREATIRLYESKTWKNAVTAALAITPQIVEMSRNGNGDLAPTTTKPLAWIREYIRMKKTSS